MDEPILKINWERFQDHITLDTETATKLVQPYTHSPIDEVILYAEGCSDTNYKITFKDKTQSPVVIRLYIRDKSALPLEAALHHFVKDKIPVPKFLYVNEKCENYHVPYAIIEWVEGVLMRDIILSGNETDISECTFEAGCYLNQLRKIKLPQRGFFEKDLTIRSFTHKESFLPYVRNLLANPMVTTNLGEPLVKALSRLIKWNSILLITERQNNLTHADYDPSNLIFKKIDGKWKMVALLDWEFSFSGIYLIDVGMMLRYSHKLPEIYEKQFIAGIQSNGFRLPRYWKKKSKLLDVLCLLYLINFDPIMLKPNLIKDVVELLTYTVNNWKKF